MSGHSKWANIKRKKEKEDKKRGKIFSKVLKAIQAAVREGGPDPEANPKLRRAIEEAKSVNMPKENIERAIKKGSGEENSVHYEECSYEGYGPGGVAVLVESLTDNKKRTTSEIRHIFAKNGGSLGEAGCVSWLFSRKGVFIFERASLEVDTLFEMAIEAGADDIKENDDGTVEIHCPVEIFEKLKKMLEEKGFKYISGEITRVPQTVVKISGKEAEQMVRLLEMLEDHEDVQKVYSNFDIEFKELERLAR